MKNWMVYMIQAESGKLYTGITTNLVERFNAHKASKRGARFFHFSQPQKIVYVESNLNRSQAAKRESAIKKMSRLEKLLLVNGDISSLL